MRAIIEFVNKPILPLVRMYIFHAPHRRMPGNSKKRAENRNKPVRVSNADHLMPLTDFRKGLWKAWNDAGHTNTIDFPIELKVTWIDPLSPDMDSLLLALYQALDGKTGVGPTILADDSLIKQLSMGILENN